MSTTVDERVVQMRFRSEDFEQKAKDTIQTLEKLKASSDFTGAGKGLDSLSNTLNNVSKNANFTPIVNGVETIKLQFSALQTISDTIWRRITNSAITAAHEMVVAFTTPLQLIKNGGQNRALNLENAKFQLEGLGVAWSKIEEDINYGVKDTAYGLDAAAKAASQLVASQVQLGDEMKTALRGISGVAAMTNSSYEDISRIFTSVAGNGRVMGEQLMSLSSRGLNAAATLGKAMGKSEAEIREMVSKGKIDFKTFAKAMDDAFGEHAKDANKTYEGSLSNVKAALSRLGATVQTTKLEMLRRIFVQTIPVIDNFKKAIEPITSTLSNGMIAFSDTTTSALKKISVMLGGTEFAGFSRRTSGQLQKLVNVVMKAYRIFIDSDGVKTTIKAFSNLFNALLQILKPVMRGFQSVIPKGFVGILVDIVTWFEQLTKKLWLTVDAQAGITKISKATADALVYLFNVLSRIAHAFGDAASGVKNFVEAMLEYIGMPQYHDNPLGWVADTKIYKFLSSLIPKALSVIKFLIEGIVTAIEKLGSLVKRTLGNGIIDFSQLNIFKGLGKVIDAVVPKLKAFAEVVKQTIQNLKDNPGMDFAESIKKAFVDTGFVDKVTPFLNGLLDVLGSVLTLITDALKTIKAEFSNTNLVAKGFFGAFLTFQAVLFHVSKSIRGLAGLLQNVRKNGITGFGEDIHKTVRGFKDLTKTWVTQAQAQLLLSAAGAILLLAIALKVLSTIRFERLITDSIALIALMKMLSLFVEELGKAVEKVNVFKVSTIMLALSISIGILASAMKKIGEINSIEGTIGAVGSIITMMVMLVVAIERLSKISKKLAVGAGIFIGLSVSIGILSLSVIALANAARNGDLSQGFRVLIETIAAFVGALIVLSKFTKEIAVGAGLMLAFAVSIGILALSVKALAEMPWTGVAQGILFLLSSMVLLVASMWAMSKFVKDMAKCALVMLTFAISIRILASAVSVLAGLDPVGLALGLGSIAALMLGLFVVMKKMSEEISEMAKVSAVLLAFAISVKILASSISMIAGLDPFAMLASLGAIMLLLVSLAGVMTLLDKVNISLKTAVALVAMALACILIASALSLVANAIVALSNANIEGLGAAIAILAVTFAAFAAIAVLAAVFAGPLLAGGAALIVFGLGITACVIPLMLLYAGFVLLITVMPQIVVSITETFLAFMDFMRALRDNAEEFGEIAASLSANFVSGLIKGFAGGVGKVVSTIAEIAKKVIDTFRKLWDEHSPSKKAQEIGDFFIQGIVKGLNAINKIKEAAKNIAQGLINGLKEKLSNIKETAKSLGNTFINSFKNVLGIHSPSKVMDSLGGFMIAGLTNGLNNGEGDVEDSTTSLKNAILNAFGLENLSPTITPVLDLSEVEAGAGRISELLSSGNYAVATVNAIAESETNNNSNQSNNSDSHYQVIVGAIQNLRSDVTALGNKMNGLKVYMNANALVGEIAPAMNQRLGATYTQNKRATGSRR